MVEIVVHNVPGQFQAVVVAGCIGDVLLEKRPGRDHVIGMGPAC